MRKRVQFLSRTARRFRSAPHDLAARLRRAAWAFRGGEYDYRLTTGTFGAFFVAYRRSTADELVLAHSFEHDIFLAGVPEYVPEASDVVIDVGAHIGTFTMLVSRRVARVFAVEASDETCQYLRINCRLNHVRNVDVSHLALGGQSGVTRLYHDRRNWGHSIVARRSLRGEQVQMASLADFMRTHEIAECAFMRMNCEGAEFPIVLAAPVELLQTIGAMLVLYHCDLVPDHAPEQLVRHLESAGFTVEVRNRSAERGWIVATRT